MYSKEELPKFGKVLPKGNNPEAISLRKALELCGHEFSISKSVKLKKRWKKLSQEIAGDEGGNKE